MLASCFRLCCALLLSALFAPVHAQPARDSASLRMIVHPEPPMLIPAFNLQGPTLFVAGKLYEGLLSYSFDLQAQPGLAKSWEMAPDGLAYTFYLQEGVTWHDGAPFTADDVVFSLAELLPQVHPRARVIFGNVLAGVDKLDTHTVRVRLKKPFPAFLLMFDPGMTILPKHIYAGTDYLKNPANQTPIGTGPFKFKEWKRGEVIRLERNPNYWKPGLPYLDELIFSVIPDAASRAVAFEQGQVDVLRGGDVDNVDVKRLRALPDVVYEPRGMELFSPHMYLVFNMRRPPFDDVRVRQAVMAALNRQMIVNTIFFGMGKPSTGAFSSTEMFYEPNTPAIHFDLAQARALIQASGITPAEHTIRLLGLPYGPTWERLDEYLKQVLEQLGFRVQIEATDAGGWASRVGQWDFDLTVNYIYQYGDPALGVERLYVADNIAKGSPFANVQGYRNPEADAWWRAAASETEPARRQALYSQLQTRLVQDMANGFLIDMELPTLYRSRVQNLVRSAIGVNDTFAEVHLQ